MHHTSIILYILYILVIMLLQAKDNKIDFAWAVHPSPLRLGDKLLYIFKDREGQGDIPYCSPLTIGKSPIVSPQLVTVLIACLLFVGSYNGEGWPV